MFSPRRCSSRPGSVARQSPDFGGLRQASDPAMGDPSNPGKNSMGNSMGTWSAAENSMGFHECLSFVHSEVSEILKTHWWECLKLILKLISQVNSLIYTPFFAHSDKNHYWWFQTLNFPLPDAPPVFGLDLFGWLDVRGLVNIQKAIEAMAIEKSWENSHE